MGSKKKPYHLRARPARRGPWSLRGNSYEMWMIQKGLCAYCNQPMLFPPSIPNTARCSQKMLATKEHLKRKVDGGEAEGNLVLAHMKCNQNRCDMPWNIWKSVCLGEWNLHEAVIACEEIEIEVPHFERYHKKAIQVLAS